MHPLVSLGHTESVCLSVQEARTFKLLCCFTVVFVQQEPLKPILCTSLVCCVSGRKD